MVKAGILGSPKPGLSTAAYIFESRSWCIGRHWPGLKFEFAITLILTIAALVSSSQSQPSD